MSNVVPIRPAPSCKCGWRPPEALHLKAAEGVTMDCPTALIGEAIVVTVLCPNCGQPAVHFPIRLERP